MKRANESELTVITRAKELCQYILVITDKSPKKYRFTLVSRMQNYALSIIEHLLKANYIFIGGEQADNAYARRGDMQQEAMTELRLLAYVSMVAREAQCILPKQHSQISSKIVEIQRLLYAWIKSDEERRK